MSLAYLIARAADTIADSPCESPQIRAELLRRFHHSLSTVGRIPQLNTESVHPSEPKEVSLLEALPRIDYALSQASNAERKAITEVVATLVEGMLWDQELFPAEALESRAQEGLSDEEFEKYTFLVAGCVGPFWSKVCCLADPSLLPLLSDEAKQVAREFGKALQWVNILRDTPKDQAEHRFYFPALNTPQFRQRFLSQARRAMLAFQTAFSYPSYFPPTSLRHRMAVLWPLVIGLRTLEKLFLENGPRPGARVKVSRKEVLAWVAVSPFVVLTNWGIEAVLSRLFHRTQHALNILEEHFETHS